MSSKFIARLLARYRVWAVVVVASALLAGCGGGGQIAPFAPTRVLAFGDESSLIETDGRKYSINAFRQITVGGVSSDDPTALDCTLSPLWIQAVATSFNLAFDRCLGTAAAVGGQILAQQGHKVADFAAQIAAVQGAALSHSDMALVMIGMYDVLELYSRYPASSRDTLLAEASRRGADLGTQINQLALRGPAVVVLTVPDIGLSPFALAQNTSSGDATRSALISDLVAAFNNRMSVALINDGRLIGLVYADVETQNNVKLATNYGLTNVVAPACRPEAALPGCTPATLVDTATATTWLWADALHLSPAGQARLGLLAQARARGNPF